MHSSLPNTPLSYMNGKGFDHEDRCATTGLSQGVTTAPSPSSCATTGLCNATPFLSLATLRVGTVFRRRDAVALRNHRAVQCRS